jgi:hypothetical protein
MTTEISLKMTLRMPSRMISSRGWPRPKKKSAASGKTPASGRVVGAVSSLQVKFEISLYFVTIP